ncbi:Hypothetical predicted protein [Olea europaea subsp. europaea]|uniref:Uncharacterized protein n=1 Tax=Olea europaea subsp. europaea TaxID=158383 RepID=A0A8S0VBY7_OLEEU|nr:Hypothetical predicted protein [Olea europaea subsp. europaea]
MVNGRSQLAREQTQRHEMFLRLYRTYVRNPNHNMLEHLDTIERITRGAENNRHEFHRDEIVYHLYRTLSPYWRRFIERLEEMFEYQPAPAGYEHDRRSPRSPPSVGNFPSLPIVDRRFNIIGKVMEEEKDPEENLGHNPGEACRDEGARRNF